MADDLLTGIDESFAAAAARRLKRPVSAPRQTSVADAADVSRLAPRVAPKTEHWISDERILDVFLGVQFLWGVVLFIPGAQALRGYVRAMPYIASLLLFGWYFFRHRRGHRPAGTIGAMSALVLLLLNLLHPSSQLTAGLAQWVFQLSIMGPLFWSYKAVATPRQLERLLVLVFLLNFASAGIGVLQVYFPDWFMPRQFNSLGLQQNEYYVESLSYIGRDGRMIVRPPGLTDQPGGAALAGGLTALLGLALSVRKGSPALRMLTLGAVAIGMAAIYLTQVRSVLLMVVVCVGVITVLAVRQRRPAAAAWLVGGGAGVVVAAFLWAAMLGGASVSDRFLNISNQGALQTYQQDRGGFLAYTVGELLDKYPLGAGVGRWGMMNTYFGDPFAFGSEPIHSEIQLTGWLLDGGLPMWIVCIGAIGASIAWGFARTRSNDPAIADIVLAGVTLQVFIAGLAMAGPIFNTQMGLLFWLIGGALYGAVTTPRPGEGTEA